MATPRNTAHMRQHGKFEYVETKNRPENAFHEKFDEFQNFSISSFLMVLNQAGSRTGSRTGNP